MRILLCIFFHIFKFLFDGIKQLPSGSILVYVISTPTLFFPPFYQFLIIIEVECGSKGKSGVQEV